MYLSSNLSPFSEVYLYLKFTVTGQFVLTVCAFHGYPLVGALFFLISVNSAALFTEISKKSCHKLLLGSGFNRPTLTNSKLRILCCLCQSASCPHHKEQTTCSECSYLEVDLWFSESSDAPPISHRRLLWWRIYETADTDKEFCER